MTEDELLDAIRRRIVEPGLRVDMDTIPSPAIYRTATSTEVEKAESELGFRIPALLRRIYLEVANGGFGPGAGLVGIEGGYPDADGRTLAASYAAFRSYGLREGLLPVFDLGCGAWSCVDALTPDARIVTLNEAGPTPTRFTLRTWLEGWVMGIDLVSEIFEIEDGIAINPFTQEPVTVKRRGKARGA